MKEIKTIYSHTAQGIDERVNALLREGWTPAWRALNSHDFFYVGLERSTIAPNPELKNETQPERCGAVYHNNLRPCVVSYHEDKQRKERRAFFHAFTTMAHPVEPSPLRGGAPGGQLSEPYAVVEYEDGQVEFVAPIRVRFLDTAHIMERYDWEVQE